MHGFLENKTGVWSLMKRFISWLYYRIVYLPEMEKKLKQYYPEANITVRRGSNDPLTRQAEREREWISDDELH